jgi:hypothetical protein
VSTRKLVDSLEEQALLEEMIDRVKPPEPARHNRGLHYLLWTPFRYPPLRHGSRFGTRMEMGIWYGSISRETAFSEVAYYRLVFLEGSDAALAPLTTELTAFRASLRSRRGVDLARSPFDRYRRRISSPVKYDDSQRLGRDMRADEVEMFRYHSARHDGGVNVGAFTPAVFGTAKPRSMENWLCIATTQRVEFLGRDFLGADSFAVERGQFLVDGALPVPAF